MSFTASLDQIIEQSTNGLLAKHPSWCRVRLGEVAKILNGFSFPSEGFSINYGTPLLRIRDILKDRTEATFEGLYDPIYIVEPGDLVVGMDGDFNAALWRGPRALLNQRVCKITPDSQFYSKRFLFYLLPGYLQIINTHTSSITVKHLSSYTVADIPLPLPPLSEQNRIVAELEKQFTRLDVAISSLRHAQKALKSHRASILKAACEGRLVPTEAELARAEGREYEQAGSFLSPLPPGLLPEGWVSTTIERLNPAGRPCAYGVLQPGANLAEGTLCIRVGDINDGKVARGELKRIDPAIASKYPRTRLMGGEVLITLVGAIGRTAVVPSDLAGANTARAVGVIPIVNRIDPKWIEIWLRSPKVRAEIASKAHEVARKTLNLEDVRRSAVALPPYAEQVRIVAEVELRVSLLDELQLSINVSLKRTEGLRQAILRQAFEGKLVHGDPADEPAAILLERIRESLERAGDSRPRRGRGIKPGVSTPGPEAQPVPKSRKDGGSVRESPSVPSGLPDNADDDVLALKPQALSPNPVRAEVNMDMEEAQEDLNFLSGSRDAQIDAVWEVLLGHGQLHKEEAIRTAAQALRDRGLASFQRLRHGGPLWEKIAAAIDRGVREGSFDRPWRGYVRAILPDARDYTPEIWRLCLLESLDGAAIEEDQALRGAADWARENLGLAFTRLRKDGVILQGLTAAAQEAAKARRIELKNGQIRLREN